MAMAAATLGDGTVRAVPSASEQRRRLLEDELDRLVAIVTEQLQAERVVLFGSFARGRVHPWSDLDVAVVAPTRAPFYERLDRVVRAVRPRVGLDLLVYTPEEWAELCATRPFLREEVLEKGRVIFERRS